MTTTVAFLNLPWWEVAPIPGHPDQNYLRRGIRAGSRWPFTSAASAPPGSANVRIGEYLPAPFFLQSAAAWTARALPGAKVILRDSIARYESMAEFNEWWCSTVPSHVIIETGTPCWENDYKFIKAMKVSNPKVKIAVAGSSARELSKHGYPEVDAYILGEYEKGSVAFVESDARGVIPFNLLTKEELANAPFPMFDEACWHHYADANPKGALMPELTVWGSRGCWAVCNFCSFPATMTNDDPFGHGGRKIRYYHPEWLEGFIRYRMAVAKNEGKPLQSIRWDADTENASNKHTLAICDVMRRIGLPWSAMCRADTSSYDVWQKMKDSGCFGVKLGFESGSDRIVNQVVNKKLDLKEAAENARYIRSLGMSVHGTFMIGHPTETPEEVQMTHDFIKHLYETGAINSHQLSGTATIEGTPLANSNVTDPNFMRDGDGVRKVEKLTAK